MKKTIFCALLLMISAANMASGKGDTPLPEAAVTAEGDDEEE